MTITNEMIAIEVMGWELIDNSPDASFMWRTPLAKARHADYLIELPNFLHDISAAWLIVEEMRGRGYEIHLISRDDGSYIAMFENSNDSYDWYNAPTAPEAICRAALAAARRERWINAHIVMAPGINQP